MEKINNYIIKHNLIEKILLIFLIIQPLLDFYFLFNKDFVSFLSFSPSTIIRILGIFIICLMFLLVNKNKKEYKYLIIYGVLVLLYAICHHLNALNFTDFYNGYDFGYNLISELFYILRMLLPLSIIYISWHYNFDDKKIEKLLTYLIIIICGSIIVTNLFTISLGSYSKETIKGNIFCWFQTERCNLSYYDLASKAFFNDPNRLASLLVLLSSITYYIFIKKSNLKNALLVFATFLGTFILGTKVSTYGFTIITILAFIIYLFFTFIKKELCYKHSVGLFLLIMIALTIYTVPLSPAINRTLVEKETIKEYKAKNEEVIDKDLTEISKNIEKNYKDKKVENHEVVEEKTIEEMLKELNEAEKKELLLDYIAKNYEFYRINPQFIILSYPYQYDVEFWFNIMNKPLEERTNFRYIEELMLKRVKEINNNKYDDYLGITFTRMGNIFDLERDFVSQYYTMGIFGVILLVMPYLIIILICIIKIFINLKDNLNLKNVFYLLGIGISLCAAYYSGNVLDGLIVTLILGFFIGQFVANVFRKPKEDVKFTIIMPTYNDADTIEESLESVIDLDYSNWELLISNDGSSDNTEKIVKKFIKDHKDKNIRYFYEENRDQLNAILNVIDEISGDYVYVLHSDDLICRNALSKANNYLKYNDVDAIISDYYVIDENSKKVGLQRVNNYNPKRSTMALQLLWLGRNLYVDVAFHKKETFITEVKDNYLIWNMPFWLTIKDKPKMLNVSNVYFPSFKYRIYENNYINNMIGKLNVVNGEIRTAVSLMKYFYIPCYEKQYLIYRVFNKMHLSYVPLYFNKETQEKGKIIEFILNKRFTEDEIKNNKFLNNLILFYNNNKKRSIEINSINKNDFIYYGKDMRKFNNDLLNNNLSEIYKFIIDEMHIGFDKIIVANKEDVEKVNIVAKFLCIQPYVTIQLNNKQK